MTIRAAIYARVSSQVQRERQTIENQLLVLPAFVHSQGWTLAGTYVDDGRSAKAGKLEARDGFARLLRDAEARLFDVLVVVDIDRLTRTDDMTERAAILGPFQRLGIRIVTPTGGELDLRSMMGELYVTLQAIVAAEENRKRAERVRAGKTRAIAEGRKPAGPTPFGYAYDRKTGEWSVHPVNGPLVVEIFERIAAGESCEAIALDLETRGLSRPRGGMWIRERVWQIATKRTYLGEWTADKARAHVVKVPQIITEDLWQRTQRALRAHGKRGLNRTKHVYLLAGLARCGACGAEMGIRSGNQRGVNHSGTPSAYVCTHRRRPPRGTQACTAACVPTADVDDRVWQSITHELEDPALIDAIIKLERQRSSDSRDWRADAKAAEDHIARLDRTERQLMARFRRGLITSGPLDDELAALQRERRMARQQLAAANAALANIEGSGSRLEEVREVVAALRGRIAQATPAERQRIVAALVPEGGAVFDGRRVRLSLLVDLAAPAAEAPPADRALLALGQADTAG